MNNKNNLIENLILMGYIILCILCTLGAVYINSIISNEILSNILIISVALLPLVIVFLMTNFMIISKDEKIKNEVKEMIQISISKYGFERRTIHPDKELVSVMEKNCKFSEIWVVTYDLNEEIDDENYKKIVKNNLKKRIKYRYIVPEADLIIGQKDRFFKAYKKKYFKKNIITLEFIKNENIFENIECIGFTIYHPKNESSVNDIHGFMRIEIPNNDYYWILMSSNDTSKLKGQIDKSIIRREDFFNATH